MTPSRLAVFVLAAVGCGRAPSVSPVEDAVIDVFGPGALLGRFPQDPTAVTGDTLLEGALEIAVDDKSIFVLDQRASVVWHLDLAARPVARLGPPGRGPGELDSPVSIRLGPDGSVWVAQPRAGRLTRIDPEGSSRVDVRTPFPAVNFGVLADGRPIVPTMSAATLFQAIEADGSTEELRIADRALPPALRRGPQDRLSFRGLQVVRLYGGVLAVLHNRHGTDFSLWGVGTAGAASAGMRVSARPLPRWLYDLLEQETEQVRATLSEEFATGDFMIPFKGLHFGDRRIWLVPAPSHRALAVGLPLADGESVHVIVGRSGEHAGLIDAAVMEGRLVALYQTEVRVHELVRLPRSEFTVPGR